MAKITEKDTPNFLFWSNPYLKEHTVEELLRPDPDRKIEKEDNEADEKWITEIVDKLNSLDEETRVQYLKEFNDNISKQCENIVKQIDDYGKK